MAVGVEYGKAYFMLTEECGTTENAIADLIMCEQVFKNNPEYVKLLETPALTTESKLSLIDEAFSSVDENLKNLIKILCEKRLLFAFDEVKSSFCALYDESRGIEHVEAVSAVPMSDEQLSLLAEKLSHITGKRIIVKNTVAPEILGGVKLRYSGIQLDGSVRTRLDKFENNLKNLVI